MMPATPAGAFDQTAAEAEYLSACRAGDDLGAIQSLLGMVVWLPVRGEQQDYVVTHREDHALVRAYTSRSRVPAGDAVRRRFALLVRTWRHPTIGLVINPDSESEFHLPRYLFDGVLAVLRQRTGERHVPSQYIESSRPAPVTPPNEIDGFRFAAVVDSVDEAGTPAVSPSRGRVESIAERHRVAAYLDGGALVQLVPGFVADVFDAAKGNVVPASTRTDGRWIWSDGVGYYLETYGIAPEPDFHRVIAAAGYRCPPVTEDQVVAAGRAVAQRERIAGDLLGAMRRAERGDPVFHYCAVFLRDHGPEPIGLIAQEVSPGPLRAVIWDRRRREWRFAPDVAASLVYDLRNRRRWKPISRQEAESVARRLGTIVPSEPELHRIGETAERPDQPDSTPS